jgi:hypothetical protein
LVQDVLDLEREKRILIIANNLISSINELEGNDVIVDFEQENDNKLALLINSMYRHKFSK